jgi:hypothetical protein
VLELKNTWADGTSHLIFEPLDFLARLAALTPRPRVNLISYHGVLAPHARQRGAVVSYGAGPVIDSQPAAGVCPTPDAPRERGADAGSARRNWTWAQLMARAFEMDVLCCRRCGGRLRLPSRHGICSRICRMWR